MIKPKQFQYEYIAKIERKENNKRQEHGKLEIDAKKLKCQNAKN